MNFLLQVRDCEIDFAVSLTSFLKCVVPELALYETTSSNPIHFPTFRTCQNMSHFGLVYRQLPRFQFQPFGSVP